MDKFVRMDDILGEELSNRYRVHRGEKGSAKADKVKNMYTD